MTASPRKTTTLRFLHPTHDEQLELATDDVFLSPRYFAGSSRLDDRTRVSIENRADGG